MPEVDATQISDLGICAFAGYIVAVYGGAEGFEMLRGLAAMSANTPSGVIIPAADPVVAEGVFSPSIVIDNTSLWGGEPATMTPADLMTAWRGIVPGFDATRHELSDVEATVTGDTATATAIVDGRHWIGDQLWRPVGTYTWDLQKIEGDWKVTRMVFTMTEEIGDRALATQAMERAKALTP